MCGLWTLWVLLHLHHAVFKVFKKRKETNKFGSCFEWVLHIDQSHEFTVVQLQSGMCIFGSFITLLPRPWARDRESDKIL